MRSIENGAAASLDNFSTTPIYLVSTNFNGQINLSTNGSRTVEGVVYVESEMNVVSIDDWMQATIWLRTTPERVGTLISEDWRGATCRVWLLPTATYPQFWAMDYAVPDYGVQGVNLYNPTLLLDGVLTGGDLSGDGITLHVTHKALLRRWTPRVRCAQPVCNHIPPPGTKFTWAGTIYTLESRL